MNAAADYAAARAALDRTLPAYVSYEVQSRAKGFGFAKNDMTTLVVRSHDGKIIKGTPPSIKVGTDSSYDNELVRHAPFQLSCYNATGARRATFGGRAAEALSLAARCERDSDGGDFDTLYVDPKTHEPIAAVGDKHDSPVAVHLEQDYAHVGQFILPSAFAVAVKGSSFMSWLNVDAHQTYTHYSFSKTKP